MCRLFSQPVSKNLYYSVFLFSLKLNTIKTERNQTRNQTHAGPARGGPGLEPEGAAQGRRPARQQHLPGGPELPSQNFCSDPDLVRAAGSRSPNYKL